jgi:hypothetical protein
LRLSLKRLYDWQVFLGFLSRNLDKLPEAPIPPTTPVLPPANALLSRNDVGVRVPMESMNRADTVEKLDLCSFSATNGDFLSELCPVTY